MSGEHGDGLQRSELNERIFGPELYEAMRELKRIFDPAGLMNPGKKVDAPSMIENLRYGPAYHAAPDQDVLRLHPRGRIPARGRAVQRRGGLPEAQGRDDVSVVHGHARRAGHDPRAGPTPCATRWPAGPDSTRTDFTSKATYEVMDLCLSCKACKTECPSSVDMAKLKMEFLAHYHDAHGTPLRATLFGHIHTIPG